MLTRESSVFISWESPEENGGNLIRSYDIRQYPTDNPAAVTSHHQWARDLLEGRTTNNRWSGNLTAHEEYTVEVWASNRIGNGPWTAVTLILRREPVQLSVTTLTAEDGALKVAWNRQRPPSPIFGLG